MAKKCHNHKLQTNHDRVEESENYMTFITQQIQNTTKVTAKATGVWVGGGGLKYFSGQIFILDSAVVKSQN